MFTSRNNGTIAAGLVLAVALWGGNNVGAKFLVKTWPPIWTASTRSLCAGLLIFALLRWTRLLGESTAAPASIKRQLWWRTGLSLAVYLVIFTWALRLTAVSHVALYLGASPVWALLWEGTAGRTRWMLAKRYGAAVLALLGVLALFWPSLRHASSHTNILGELFGLAASVLWTVHGRQCRLLGNHLTGAQLTAHNMWRAGLLMLPLALYEAATNKIIWQPQLIGIQAYCIAAGAVVSFALWNNALRHWKTSEVYLFNNLIPVSTMLWAHFCVGEPMTSTFWTAMGLVVAGVVIGQTNWEKFLGAKWLPAE